MQTSAPALWTLTVKCCITTIIVVMILASIQPPYWPAYLLHQTGTLIFVISLLLVAKFYHIRSSSWIWTTVFVLLHIVGARYIYSFVPYDDWLQIICGISLEEVFGWQRNMYDRLVHFAFGFCLCSLLFDVCQKAFSPLSTRKIILIVLFTNMSLSMLYEQFEWLLAIIMSPENAEAYNGQQGDMWDAHKDMGLALAGGIAFLPFLTKQKITK